MVHKIAILNVSELPSRWDEYSTDTIVNSITDWAEVSDEDYNILVKGVGRLNTNHNTYHVIEHVTNVPKFIATTVADFKKAVAEETKRRAEAKRLADEKALAKKLKQEQKKKETKRQLLARLKAELGEE